jgi:hypothetical protein
LAWQSLAGTEVAPVGAGTARVELSVVTPQIAYPVLFDEVYLSECPGGF